MITDEFISYIGGVRRYSARTRTLYENVLKEYAAYVDVDGSGTDAVIVGSLVPRDIRNYEMHLLEERRLDARTVNLHLSALSSFCRYLLSRGIIRSNPVKLIARPKQERRLPVFFRKDSMSDYFKDTEYNASEEAFRDFVTAFREAGSSENARKLCEMFYRRRLGRLIVRIFYETGLRRAELIGLNIGAVDHSLKMMTVRGKGDKMREIPFTPSLSEEILLYLNTVALMVERERDPAEPLLVTFTGGPLYPVYVERVVKEELGQEDSITGRKSPHVLRHTLATELLDDGADMYSIKELLGHSSLAATQVYTHNTVEKLKKVYLTAHPRAKRGGNNGD